APNLDQTVIVGMLSKLVSEQKADPVG
ncbi:uncharacterized protein METZ01_LOCUS514917, partial [marine metagenome]